MATILFSKVSDDKVRIIDVLDPESHKLIYKVVETGFVNANEKIAINHARKYLHNLVGIESKKSPREEKKSKVVRWQYNQKSNSLKINNEELLSIAEEIKRFKAERNEKRSKRIADNKPSSKRNVSGVRLDPNWREVYRRKAPG